MSYDMFDVFCPLLQNFCRSDCVCLTQVPGQNGIMYRCYNFKRNIYYKKVLQEEIKE